MRVAKKKRFRAYRDPNAASSPLKLNLQLLQQSDLPSRAGKWVG